MLTFRLLVTALAVIGFLPVGRSTGFSTPASQQDPPKPDRKNDPQEWLTTFARTGQSFSDGTQFLLRVHQLEPGVNRYDVGNQNVFLWHESLPRIISSQSPTLNFKLQDGSVIHDFIAARSKDYDGTWNNEEDGEFFWEGNILDQGGDDESSTVGGELSCGFSWGTLDCNIRSFSDVVDSHYRIIMEERHLNMVRTLKTDLDESQDALPGDPGRSLAGEPALSVYETTNSSGLTSIDFYDVDDHDIDGRRLQMSSQTDIVVFYTEAACSEFGSCAGLEREIRSNINRFNVAASDAGVTRICQTLNLVATWKLFDSDKSGWTGWISTRMSDTVIHRFTYNKVLNNRRSNLGADVMVLIHDWDYGAGMAYMPGYSSLIHPRYLSSYSIQHELGHNFNLKHCMGDSTFSYRTIMAYGAARRINQWSSKASTVFRQISNAPDYDGPSLSECKTEVFGHCCTRQGTVNLNEAWNYKPSKGAVRLSPSVVGNQIDSSWRSCRTGVRGLGLLRFIYEDDEMDNYRLQVVCRGKGLFQLGMKRSGHDSVERIDPRSCKEGKFVRGVALYRYRDEDADKDNYRIGIFCPLEGWIFTPEPEGDLVSTSHGTSNYGIKRDLTFAKWNTFREEESSVDTYDMSLAWAGKPVAPTEVGSLFQDAADYRCMTSTGRNNVIMSACHGRENQQWFMNESKQIKNVESPDLCLQYAASSRNAFLRRCDGSITQKWLHDRSTQQFRSASNEAKCLHRVVQSNNLLVRNCENQEMKQKFVFDSYTFSILPGRLR